MMSLKQLADCEWLLPLVTLLLLNAMKGRGLRENLALFSVRILKKICYNNLAALVQEVNTCAIIVEL